MNGYRSARLFAALAFAAVTGCTNGKCAPEPAASARAAAGETTIARLGYDIKSAALDRIELSSAARAQPAAAPAAFDYVVVAGDARATFWSGADGGPDPEDATRELVILKPEAGAPLPPQGARVLVKSIDRATGDERDLASGVVEKRTGTFVDPSLAAFVTVPRIGTLPAGWGPSGNATASGAIRKFERDGITGTSVTLAAHEAGWNSFGLAQNVPLKDAERFTVRVFPTRDCDGDSPAPTALGGVAIADAVGHLAQFCLSSKIVKPVVTQFSEGRQLIAVYPGRLGTWNDLTIDMRAMRSIFRLYPAKQGYVVVTLGISLHPSASGKTNDTIGFADITVK